jgi:hypothetical protein
VTGAAPTRSCVERAPDLTSQIIDACRTTKAGNYFSGSPTNLPDDLSIKCRLVHA